MRDITISYKDGTVVSLSHWGLFVANISHTIPIIITGLDAYMKPYQSDLRIPVYKYRPLTSMDFL